MTGTYSLQRRLSLLLTLLVLALWGVATLAGAVIVRHELDEVFDSALQELAQRLLPLAVETLYRDDPTDGPRHIAALAGHEEYLTYLVRDADGHILIRSHDADPSAFPGRPTPGFRSFRDVRLYTEAGVSGTVFVEVAEPLGHRREAAWEASLGLLAPILLLAPLSLLAVWGGVRRGLVPVTLLRRQIERRGDADLTPIAGLRLPSEIAPVAGAVNRLMARLDRALAAERSFAANSAHELRTPLAGALAQTQRLIAEAPEGPLRDRAVAVAASLNRLSHLSEKLLQLARAESGLFPPGPPTDLAPLVPMILDDLIRAAEGRLLIDPAAPLIATIDPDAFALLLRNLVENALKHSPRGTRVIVRVLAEAVHIRNQGPVVDFDRLRARFARGTTRASGSGLGLAIVDALAAATGAAVAFRSPAPGAIDGVEVVLTPPA